MVAIIDKIFDNSEDGKPNYAIDLIDGTRLYARGKVLNPLPTKGDAIDYTEVNTKTSANGRLQATDWYVTRKAEAGTAIPSDVSTYRTAVRTSSKTIEDKINACSDLTAFKKLFDTPVDGKGNPTGTAPIYDFPKEVI